MQLTPALVAAYKEALQNPQNHELDFEPLENCFIKSDTVTANHILARQYLDYTARGIPKVIFYIIMQEIYGHPKGKDAEGHFGYYLTFKPELLSNETTPTLPQL